MMKKNMCWRVIQTTWLTIAIMITGSYALAEEISSAMDDLYTNGLARGDEEQADNMAVIICARAGYDPYSYIAVIQKIASEKPDSAAWQTFMKRHPSANDRLTALEPLMDSVFSSPGNYLTLSSRYQKSIR